MMITPSLWMEQQQGHRGVTAARSAILASPVIAILAIVNPAAIPAPANLPEE